MLLAIVVVVGVVGLILTNGGNNVSSDYSDNLAGNARMSKLVSQQVNVFPDLYVDNVWFESSFEIFGPSVRASICNRGAGFTLDYGLDVSFAINGDIINFGGYMGEYVDNGACYFVFAPINEYNFPSVSSSDVYGVTVSADYSAKIVESNDLNNVETVFIYMDLVGCLDSDGGEDVFVSGSANGWNPYVEQVITEEDICGSGVWDGYLHEAVCGFDTNDQIYIPGHKDILCPQGCTAGACLPVADCFDSDNGQNYYEQGTLVWTPSDLYLVNVDYCTGNSITEYECISGESFSTVVSCPNGCEDGACIRREPVAAYTR